MPVIEACEKDIKWKKKVTHFLLVRSHCYVSFASIQGVLLLFKKLKHKWQHTTHSILNCSSQNTQQMLLNLFWGYVWIHPWFSWKHHRSKRHFMHLSCPMSHANPVSFYWMRITSLQGRKLSVKSQGPSVSWSFSVHRKETMHFRGSKSSLLERQTACIWVPGLPLTSCVTLF